MSMVLLMVSFSLVLAQTPRQPTSSEGKTTFTNIAVVGLDVSGVPGYIEMVSSAGETYYLYIDDTGNLNVASAQTVGSGASPQTTDWNNYGTTVGEQQDD